ncbi:MAG: hypothetical protein ABI723_01220 [Bacteroidia bacterium]
MKIEGEIAFDNLNSRKISIADHILVGVKLFIENFTTNIDLSFAKSIEGNPNIIIQLKKVIEFDFHYDEDTYYIEDYKIFYNNESNEFYLSLDPDYMIIEKSQNDCGIIKAKGISVITTN